MSQRRIVDLPFDNAQIRRAVMDTRGRLFTVADRQVDIDRGVTRVEGREERRQPIGGDRLAGDNPECAARQPAEVAQHRLSRFRLRQNAARFRQEQSPTFGQRDTAPDTVEQLDRMPFLQRSDSRGSR